MKSFIIFAKILKIDMAKKFEETVETVTRRMEYTIRHSIDNIIKSLSESSLQFNLSKEDDLLKRKDNKN